MRLRAPLRVVVCKECGSSGEFVQTTESDSDCPLGNANCVESSACCVESNDCCDESCAEPRVVCVQQAEPSGAGREWSGAGGEEAMYGKCAAEDGASASAKEASSKAAAPWRPSDRGGIASAPGDADADAGAGTPSQASRRASSHVPSAAPCAAVRWEWRVGKSTDITDGIPPSPSNNGTDCCAMEAPGDEGSMRLSRAACARATLGDDGAAP